MTFFSCATASSDLVFPTDVVGGEYRVVTPANSADATDVVFQGSKFTGGLFAAVAGFDDTTITVTPTIGIDGHAAGIPFDVTLQAGEVIRIDDVPVKVIDAGQVYEFLKDGQGTVSTNKPVLLVQMTDSSPNLDPRLQVVGKEIQYSLPAMMVIPPYEQYLAEYTISAPDSFPVGFANVVAPDVAIGAVEHNGQVIDPVLFESIGSTGFSVARVSIAEPVEDPENPGQIINVGGGERHNFEAPLPFGITSYGFEFHNTHAHLGGLSLAPVATATGIALIPPTATRLVTTTHAVTAKVTDDEGRGVPGVRVDFRTEGVHQVLGFGVTDLRGECVSSDRHANGCGCGAFDVDVPRRRFARRGHRRRLSATHHVPQSRARGQRQRPGFRLHRHGSAGSHQGR